MYLCQIETQVVFKRRQFLILAEVVRRDKRLLGLESTIPNYLTLSAFVPIKYINQEIDS